MIIAYKVWTIYHLSGNEHLVSVLRPGYAGKQIEANI
jgi:hypothetical protein